MSSLNLVSLLHLCDPALPIGSFSHSAGLETYVQADIVNSAETAKQFITNQLSFNLFYTDAALVSLAYDAMVEDNLSEVLELDALCNAVKLPKEIRVASNKLALRLLKIFDNNDEARRAKEYRQAIIDRNGYGHYCIAFALLAVDLGIEKDEALTGFYYNATSGFVTNAVKLIPLGQQTGQEILLSLLPLINELAGKTLYPDETLIGYSCAGFDIRSMQHEQLYSRLYMS
ncbi:MAG: urease accessory protein UreF [Ginsengibacter sp.]